MATRPRNRRALIVAAAADQFHRVGYGRVTTADIAAALGITAGALYWHFPSKQDLLCQVILDRFHQFEEAVRATAHDPTDNAVRALNSLGLDLRDFGVLWQRESRQLPAPERDTLRRRFRELALQMADRVGADRPELTGLQRELLAWSVFAIVASPSHSTIEIPRPRFDELLSAVAGSVLAAPLPAIYRDEERVPTDPALLGGRVSRREALVDAAVELFARDGFHRVTMEDIGAAVGIAGPSIYNHFTGKPEILDSALTRGAQWLQLLVTQVLSSARTPDEASAALLRGYVNFAIAHTALIDVLIAEADSLRDERRHLARRSQHDFVADWIRLLSHGRPDCDPTELRAIVQAELTLINSIARTPHLTNHPQIADQLVSICSAIQESHLGARTPA